MSDTRSPHGDEPPKTANEAPPPSEADEPTQPDRPSQPTPTQDVTQTTEQDAKPPPPKDATKATEPASPRPATTPPTRQAPSRQATSRQDPSRPKPSAQPSPKAQPSPQARTARQIRDTENPLRQVGLTTWLLALLGVIVVALLVTTISLLARSNDLNNQVDDLETQVAAANIRANATAWILEPSPDAPSAASASGVMFYSAREQSLSVTVYGLPSLAQGQVYQLWFLEGENQARSAGLLRVDDTGLAYFATTNIQFESLPQIAISIETEGGSTSLSGPVVMIGRVSAAG